MRIAFATSGCRQNQFETDTMVDQARTAGLTLVPYTQAAEVYVINTCTVTERADADARGLIRQAIRQSPTAFVVVTGCYAQAAPERISAIDGVDLILGNVEKMELMRHLRIAGWEVQDLGAIARGSRGFTSVSAISGRSALLRPRRRQSGRIGRVPS